MGLLNNSGTDILIHPSVTSGTLAAELAKLTGVNPGTVAYNRIWYFNPSAEGALHVYYDLDGKWYKSDGNEVT